MDDNKHRNQFNASLPLPGGNNDDKPDDTTPANPAADLVRKKVEAAFAHEPDPIEEVQEIEGVGAKHHSKHQEFILELTNSGRPLHEIQTAWHEYYAALPDDQKHSVWQEFYKTQTQAAKHPSVTHQPAAHEMTKPVRHRSVHHAKIAEKVDKVKKAAPKAIREPAAHKSAASQGLHSLLFGLGTGSIVILIFMFTFFNDRIIAPFIQPSRKTTNIPLITSNTAPISKDPEVIIPKINAEIPVVYDVNSVEDADIQVGLMRGVVHYASTPSPGETGNVVIVGHSSGNIFNQGNYKFAFSLLRAMDNGDTFYLQKDGQRYTYQVYNKRVVKPTDVSVLGPADKPATATLITCDPPGLNANRLVITAEQISPDPSTDAVAASPTVVPKNTTVIPGNSISLWSRLVHWFQS